MQSNDTFEIFTGPKKTVSVFHDMTFMANIFAHRALATTRYSQDLSELVSQMETYIKEHRVDTRAAPDTAHFLEALGVFKTEMDTEAEDILKDSQKYEDAAKDLLNFQDDLVLQKDMEIKKKAFDSIYAAYRKDVQRIESKQTKFHKAMMELEVNEVKQLLAQSDERWDTLQGKHRALERKVADALDLYSSTLDNENDAWSHLDSASNDYQMAWLDIAQDRIHFIQDTLTSGVKDSSEMEKHLKKINIQRLLKTFLDKETVSAPRFENCTRTQDKVGLLRKMVDKEKGTVSEKIWTSIKRKAIVTRDYKKEKFNHISLKKGQKVKQILPSNPEGFAFGEKRGKLGRIKRGYYPVDSVHLLD